MADEVAVPSDVEYDVDGDDDPVAEGEEPLPQMKQVSEEMANSSKFSSLCVALEAVWKAKSSQPADKRLARVLPPKALAAMANADPPESIFPIFRLLLPTMDTRMTFVGESKVAEMYAGLLNLSKESRKRRMLFDYNDPTLVKKEEGLFDFSSVVRTVMKGTKVDLPSGWTVGAINEALDDFTRLKGKVEKGKERALKSPTKKRKPPTLKEYQVEWLRKLNMDEPNRKGLSALEHRWLVRILIQKNMNFGLGWQPIVSVLSRTDNLTSHNATKLRWYHPYMAMAYTARSSLRGVCTDFCDPAFRQARRFAQNISDKVGLDQYMPQSPVAPKFGTLFTPMVSEKTGFDRVLDDISKRHRAFIKSKDSRDTLKHIPVDSLAFQHPAFCVEPKLDGERLLVHVGNDGVVRLHTRRGNWYSPVLGVPMRKAVKAGLNVILDGEVIAWDSQRQETIPFGNNRGIANYRKQYLAARGLLDDRDKNIESSDGDQKAVSVVYFKDADNYSEETGAECWLKLVVFDILYVDGDGAADLLAETVSKHIDPRPAAGSIIHLDLFERKKILQRVLTPQKDFIEIVTTWIIRPNGTTELGMDYFSSTSPTSECGHPNHTIDSQSCLVGRATRNISQIDVERRNGRSDEQISEARASSVHNLFKEIENLRMEGLIFKDLAAPYYLGEESRSMRYWLKFKPDYFNGSVASDLDLAVIGCFYATGLSARGAISRAGEPSGLLCACMDSKDPSVFFPVVKVNAGSMDRVQKDIFFTASGLKKKKDSEQNGGLVEDNWFRLDKKKKELPEFVSRRSLHDDSDGSGWKVQKKDYPDEWVHPKDCPILTLNAGEIVDSPAFPAAISLRFPRITRVRVGADSKPLSEIESEHSLWKIYQEVLDSRSNAFVPSQSVQLGSPSSSSTKPRAERRFLTEAEYHETKSKKRRKTTKKALRVAVPEIESNSSKALEGLTFAVLGSKFLLKAGSIELDEATEQGWSNEARAVRNKEDIVKFIKIHGGTYKVNVDASCNFVLGGNTKDVQVTTYIKAIRGAISRSHGKKKAVTKRDKTEELMARSKGVLRWTVPFSLVHRWLQKPGTESKSIKEEAPSILGLSSLDYLARPSESLCDASVYERDLSSVNEVRRALDMVAHSYDQSIIDEAWQVEARKFDTDDQWIASCGWEELWRFRKPNDVPDRPAVVIYPDIFNGYRRKEKPNAEQSWKETRSDAHSSIIESVLPLIQVMGGTVVTELKPGVTHVLCALRDSVESLQLHGSVDSNAFAERERGQCLLDHLSKLEGPGTRNGSVTLVSVAWIRKQFSKK